MRNRIIHNFKVTALRENGYLMV